LKNLELIAKSNSVLQTNLILGKKLIILVKKNVS
jgi:hypothetical protein